MNEPKKDVMALVKVSYIILYWCDHYSRNSAIIQTAPYNSCIFMIRYPAHPITYATLVVNDPAVKSNAVSHSFVSVLIKYSIKATGFVIVFAFFFNLNFWCFVYFNNFFFYNFVIRCCIF